MTLRNQAMDIDRLNFWQRIRYSIFPGTYHGVLDRERYRQLFNGLLLTVPRRTLRFTLTWGLGGMALVLVTMLFATSTSRFPTGLTNPSCICRIRFTSAS